LDDVTRFYVFQVIAEAAERHFHDVAQLNVRALVDHSPLQSGGDDEVRARRHGSSQCRQCTFGRVALAEETA
jgi:hypothetical protein